MEGLSGLRVTSISAGVDCTIAVCADGSVWGWGRNAEGQLGLGVEVEGWMRRPERVKALSGVVVTAAACGGAHTLLLSDEGAVFTCGAGVFGKLGHGSEELDEPLPRAVEALAPYRVAHVAAGDCSSHFVSLLRRGAVVQRRQRSWCAGAQLCVAEGQPARVLTPVEVVRAEGVRYCCACGDAALLDESGGVWICGGEWAVAFDEDVGRPSATPVLLPPPEGIPVVDVVAYYEAAVLVPADGSLRGAGAEGDDWGRLPLVRPPPELLDDGTEDTFVEE